MEIRLSGGRGRWIDKFWMTTLFTVLKYVLKSPLMMNIFTSLGQFYFRTIICYVFFFVILLSQMMWIKNKNQIPVQKLSSVLMNQPDYWIEWRRILIDYAFTLIECLAFGEMFGFDLPVLNFFIRNNRSMKTQQLTDTIFSVSQFRY